MTCEEFRFYVSERNALGDQAAAEHILGCAECRSLSVAQQELAVCLGAIRESSPVIGESVDAAVLNAYRRQKGSLAGRKYNLGWRTAWVPIAAVLAIAAGLWIMHGKRSETVKPQVAKTGPAEIAPPVQTSPNRKGFAKSAAAKVYRPVIRRKAAETQTRMASAQDDPALSGFQNLMYCDPISCAGAMQVIRIQLPAQDNGVGRVPLRSSGLVQADVVVGADGVARAIRLVR